MEKKVDEAMDVLFSVDEFKNKNQENITEVSPISLKNVSKMDELLVRMDSIEGRLNFLISMNEELDEKLDKILALYGSK